MRIGRGHIIGAAVMLGAVFAPPAGAATTPVLNYSTYEVPGSASTVVSGVNDSGVIAGYYTDGTGQHGFIDTNGTGATLDGPTGSTGYVVTSINNAGTITGAYWIGSTEHAFVKTATGQPTVLDYPKVRIANQQGTFASQVNNSGVVVGYYFTTVTHGFQYPDGTWGPSTTSHGFVWKNGTFTTYDAPGTTPIPQKPAAMAYGTQLLGLNNVGDMVGTFIQPTGTPVNPGFEISGVTFKSNNTANLNKKSVKFTLIRDPATGTTNACSFVNATAINDSGMIVGNSGNGCGGGHNVWESTGGVLIDVYSVQTQPVGGTVLVANSINNNGIIGGTSFTLSPGGEVDSPNQGFTGMVN